MPAGTICHSNLSLSYYPIHITAIKLYQADKEHVIVYFI